ncbi:MAG: 4-alpha-glucanotransferase [Myxococcota bacterium]|jgi:4-alpha-glucanotransferase
MRRAGVLLHPTSLPGPGPCGDLGEGALRFLDWLAAAGCSLWQTLPLNPTGGGFSPYGSPSSFAGARHLISVDRLAAEGLLRFDELGGRPHSPHHVDVDALDRWHAPLVALAARRLYEEDPGAVDAFQEANHWALDWALFSLIRAELNVDGWWQFPEGLRDRNPDALAEVREQHHTRIKEIVATQLLFERQWAAVRRAARVRGIEIIGDLPIFVAGDGCDTWCDRDLFRWAPGWRPDPVSGAPPDQFSSVGQRWGNPLYRWPEHQKTGFRWWTERFRATLSRVDHVRVDHFRGFAAAWEIPADAEDARAGRWGKSPGSELFAAVKAALGDLPIIAEDLGVITPDVAALREELAVPGMKVLQFAFGGDASHEYLPHNFEGSRWVAYTGTHDNDTALGWYRSAPEKVQHRYRVYCGRDGAEPGWDLIRAAWGSTAEWAIAPLQDVLNLGGEARMNTPGVAKGNWGWRASDLPHHSAERLALQGWAYGR